LEAVFDGNALQHLREVVKEKAFPRHGARIIQLAGREKAFFFPNPNPDGRVTIDP